MICNLCPRKCNACRTEHQGNGFCGAGTLPVVARVAPHFGEEPCISGTKGSGTVFFSGCTLKCVFCQNYEISDGHKGRAITPKELADCYKRLEEQGVHNINLVTADHYVNAVAESLDIYKPSIPVVYNCSGYTSPKTLSILDGLVDIYLPDFKYSDDALAIKYSSAPNYVNTASAAIKEMIFQVGTPEFDSDGMLKKGVIVRHLILPSHTKNSLGVLDIIKRSYDRQVLVSLMCQYVPVNKAHDFPKINRTITRREYDKVKSALYALGLDGFTQDLTSASTDFIPEWDF
ncbi:radical SAM protein [Ruminococcus sp.]|jgi:putative pyruvate formate lyase activating enzyme|uniref:radical SAM protein n=1 Tax=Ruminococcus sp. TaxID=41978 RepID=UPI00261BBEE6|nr:radical SAM protein [Ruminococcus sp.]MCI2113321.1 radical SAM protein [Ruminococcus sp.]MDD6989932.1 radical SAM protein [Ruminococcus sp.]MDY6202263.1 radical SAM protein [Ruminococcus sp.]